MPSTSAYKSNGQSIALCLDTFSASQFELHHALHILGYPGIYSRITSHLSDALPLAILELHDLLDNQILDQANKQCLISQDGVGNLFGV